MTYINQLLYFLDPRANDYFLMQSPIPMLLIVAVWYKFIFDWGPIFMKNRKPMELKSIMMVYNLFQVFANAYIINVVSIIY